MNFRKSLLMFLSSFMAISTIGSVGSVKAWDTESPENLALTACALPILYLSWRNLQSSIDDYNELTEKKEQLEKLGKSLDNMNKANEAYLNTLKRLNASLEDANG